MKQHRVTGGINFTLARYCTLVMCKVLLSSVVVAQSSNTVVSQNIMQSIYEEVKTPYKYGLVLVPESDSKKVDCPTVFRKNDKWYMTYLVFDGRGYQTWLAQSDDLLNWNTKGKLLSFSSDTTLWDAYQKAGYPSLQDTEWG